MLYQEYILSADEDIVLKVKTYCADLASEGGAWDRGDATFVAALLNQSTNPVGLFRFMDEKTGSDSVGYRTSDGREWFHILRQMRNASGSGLLENLGRK